jgi:hypothetical protein
MPLDDAPRDLAADRRDLPFESAHAGFAGVTADDLGERLVGDLEFRGLETVALQLLGDEVLPRDVELLVLGVTREVDDLHAVLQRRRDRVEQVRRRYEHHVGQVERHFEIVVLERVVLLRVERLQQRSRRVAPEVDADLVDLVHHEDRVARSRGADRLDDAAGQRADVGAPMTSDLRLVADTAERHTYEPAPERAGDRLADRGLAHTRRPDEAQDRAPHGVGELVHR